MIGLRIGLLEMRADALRTGLAVAGQSALVLCALMLACFSSALEAFLESPPSSTTIVIADASHVDPGDGQLPESLLAAVRSLGSDRVQKVSPLFFRHMRVEGRMVQVRGAPIEDFRSFHRLQLLDGRLPAEIDEVLVGEGLRQAAGWDAGQALEIYGRRMRITGVARAPGSANAAIWMTPASARDVFGPERLIQVIGAQPPGARSPEQLKRDIEALPEMHPPLAAFFEDAYTLRNGEVMRDLAALMRIAAWLAIGALIASSNAAAALHLSERPRELALLRVAGLVPRQLAAYILSRAAAVCLIAFAAGALACQAWLAMALEGGRVFVFGVPFQLALDAPLLIRFAGLSVAAALTGAGIAAAPRLRGSIAEGLRA